MGGRPRARAGLRRSRAGSTSTGGPASASSGAGCCFRSWATCAPGSWQRSGDRTGASRPECPGSAISSTVSPSIPRRMPRILVAGLEPATRCPGSDHPACGELARDRPRLRALPRRHRDPAAGPWPGGGSESAAALQRLRAAPGRSARGSRAALREALAVWSAGRRTAAPGSADCSTPRSTAWSTGGARRGRSTTAGSSTSTTSSPCTWKIRRSSPRPMRSCSSGGAGAGWTDSASTTRTGCWIRAAYFERLARSAFPDRRDEPPVWVEKILSHGERLRPEWPVAGTTGYDFLNEAEALFISPPGSRRSSGSTTGSSAIRSGFAHRRRGGKRLVLETGLSAGVRRLAERLAQAGGARADRASRCRQARSAPLPRRSSPCRCTARTSTSARRCPAGEDRRLLRRCPGGGRSPRSCTRRCAGSAGGARCSEGRCVARASLACSAFSR